jgi:Cu(I)/Ag(I) efflux system membrane fusion protein
MERKFYKIGGISVLLLLVFILAAPSCNSRKGNGENNAGTEVAEGKQYVCSMHPQVIRNSPGDCPICGMFLIEMAAGDENSYDSTLADIVRSVNNTVMGSVRWVTPELDTLPVEIDASGIINYDPRKIQTVSARFGGLIEKSFVKYQFQYVKKGQKIYEIYSPDIYTERWNYVKLIQGYPDRDDLAKEALDWFNLLGLSKGQVDSLKRTIKPDYHLPVYCYAEGYAVSRNFDPETYFFTGFREENNPETFLAGTGSIGLNDGITVETGTPLFKLIDVTALRVDLKVKTEYGPMLKRGQEVIITDAAHPDIQFVSSISQIEPLNGGLFQTAKVYIRDNERILLPGRQIKARIITDARDGLWVPVTAVVDMGQSRVVFVMNGNKFVATEVRTGIRTKDKIEILYGIDPDSMVAEKALLLTDSDGFISAD